MKYSAELLESLGVGEPELDGIKQAARRICDLLADEDTEHEMAFANIIADEIYGIMLDGQTLHELGGAFEPFELSDFQETI